jgi:hypothetical protein
MSRGKPGNHNGSEVVQEFGVVYELLFGLTESGEKTSYEGEVPLSWGTGGTFLYSTLNTFLQKVRVGVYFSYNAATSHPHGMISPRTLTWHRVRIR